MEELRIATNAGYEHPAGRVGAPQPSFLEALIDPVNTFRDPLQVVEHPWFSNEEKRTILLSWARDELLVEQVASRTAPDLAPQSRMDAVLEALSQFDAPAAGEFLAAVTSIRGVHKGQSRRERMH